MKRSELLSRKLGGPLDAIQTCRDIVEGNFNAIERELNIEPGCVRDVDIYELQARIYTDLEILAMNQAWERSRQYDRSAWQFDQHNPDEQPTPHTTSISEFARQEEEAAGSAEQYAEGTAIAEYDEPSSTDR